MIDELFEIANGYDRINEGGVTFELVLFLTFFSGNTDFWMKEWYIVKRVRI